ncbi:hypothetical protein X965_08370 [Morganella sp. EGD-HP17]|nr:hypothetical protein X965_08370 [Morganella sp. EGD-HP17]
MRAGSDNRSGRAKMADFLQKKLKIAKMKF